MRFSPRSLGIQVRIMQKSQENGQNQTNTDTGKEREYKNRENVIKGHVGVKKTHKGKDFTLNPSLKKHKRIKPRIATLAIRVSISNPTVKNRDPMIGKIQGQGFMGASNKLQDLEASLKAI
ncbi:hypothetical protein Tco_0841161 [Tanacetum coccineum]|uniref:Uncharacterized protein n=1 Tax=Tanacetum coccineum TaxID=301880 RepID=A0ABQ5B182_9ASTR